MYTVDYCDGVKTLKESELNMLKVNSCDNNCEMSKQEPRVSTKTNWVEVVQRNINKDKSI